ncbi:hypothetical protein ONA91_24895 [Micromonospora sp. DR5-3]|uniref:hypothetical protein n=1 Tax=unclassified Micromonospora TaxID=2617518 RepID=UPI0011D4DF16|nr:MULTISPECIES: hypothetical protein [unclassified Micromonospora]MCW3817696.1 hypothetical protein [Micromonospora sp. DR5-3]TYC24970.1 hypothetical protein FXF52_06540 [Micromonospora sp. MP36]
MTSATLDATATPTATGRPRRGWAVAGAVAGLTGIAIFQFGPQLANVDTSLLADNARLAAAMDGKEAYVWVFQVLTGLAAGCLAVFAAGLRRRLAAREPAGGLLPDVAAAGLLLTAALLLVGGGVSTELYWDLLHLAETDADTVATLATGYNTFPWVWAGAGLSAGAVAVAGLRRRSVSRWLAVFSLLMTLLVVVTQAVPLQYLALAPAALWATVAGLTFALERRGLGN